MEKRHKGKLNLSLEKEVISAMKKEAKSRKMSVSAFIELLFNLYQEEQEKTRIAKETGIYQLLENVLKDKIKEMADNENKKLAEKI